MNIRPLPDAAFTRQALARDRRRLETAFFWGAISIALLWLVMLAEWAAGTRFSFLGLAPRELTGLVGLIGAPLVHGSLEHLIANSIPTFVLISLGMYAVPLATARAVPLIWIVSGALVWLFARDSVHIGASGVTHGLMSFLFVLGAVRRDRITIAVALIVFFLYGSMAYGFLPTKAGISFEYHGAGLVGGVIAALLWRNLDPLPEQKRYDWEDEPENDEEWNDDPLEPPSPQHVPVLWDGPRRPTRGALLQFPSRRRVEFADDEDGRIEPER